MAQTQLPGTQVKDSSLKNVDIAADAAIDISKLALPTSLPDKATPVDADVFTGADSAASNVWKKFTWANIKATLDTLYIFQSTFLRAVKTADEYRSNTTTYGDDSQLSVNITNPGSYIVELFLNILSNGTSSIKCQFVGPTSTNYQSMRTFLNTTSATTFSSTSVAIAEFTNNEVKTDGMLQLKGRVYFANAGTFKLQWAQATAEVYSTYIRTGSSLKLIKV